jgi:hypothetical protein
LVAENRRLSPGRFQHPLRKKLRDSGYSNLGLRLAAVPVDENLLALLPCEERKAGEAAIGIRRSALEQSLELVGEPLHSRMLEKIGAVLEGAKEAELIFILRQLKCQIECRSAAGQR